MKIGLLTMISAVFAVLFLGLAFHSQVKGLSREEKLREFQAKRSVVLHKIREAEASDNLARLERIESRYAGVVIDPEFHAVLRRAKAVVQANEAKKALTIGKILDITRQREDQRSADNNRFESKVYPVTN